MARLKGRTAVIAMFCGLVFCFCANVTDSTVAKDTAKGVDPYTREVVRGKNRITVSKAFVDAVKKNHAVVLSRAAVRQRPDENGRVEAIELVQIDRGSSVAKMGFRPGDRIKSVNGMPVGELEAKRLEIEMANRWELTILRQGKPLRMVIEVRK